MKVSSKLGTYHIAEPHSIRYRPCHCCFSNGAAIFSCPESHGIRIQDRSGLICSSSVERALLPVETESGRTVFHGGNSQAAGTIPPGKEAGSRYCSTEALPTPWNPAKAEEAPPSAAVSLLPLPIGCISKASPIFPEDARSSPGRSPPLRQLPPPCCFLPLIYPEMRGTGR